MTNPWYVVADDDAVEWAPRQEVGDSTIYGLYRAAEA